MVPRIYWLVCHLRAVPMQDHFGAADARAGGSAVHRSAFVALSCTLRREHRWRFVPCLLLLVYSRDIATTILQVGIVYSNSTSV